MARARAAPPGARASQSQTSQKLTFLTIEPPNRHDAPPTRITQSASNFLHGRAAARARRILSRSAAHSSIYGAVSHRLTTRILFGRALAHAVYSAAWGGAVSHRLTSLVGRALARTPYTLPHAVAPSLTTRFDRGSEPTSHAHPRSRPWPQAHVALLRDPGTSNTPRTRLTEWAEMGIVFDPDAAARNLTSPAIH